MARQAELDSLLDLDKGDQQAAPVLDKDDPEIERAGQKASSGHDDVAKMAMQYMLKSGKAIGEIPVSERAPPQTGQVVARVVAKDDAHVAFAAAANSFFVLTSTSVGRDAPIGARLALRFLGGRASVVDGRNRGR